MQAGTKMRPDEILKEALETVEKAKERNIILRILGATGYRVHCPRFGWLHNGMKRELTDMDFVGYLDQHDDVIDLLKGLGYNIDERVLFALRMLARGERLILRNPRLNCTVDVFFDALEMSHTIDFRGRLQVDYPTIPLAELLLEKMQIHEINEKDIKDSIMLLVEHEIGAHDEEVINGDYITDLLSKDWGFYYETWTNLEKVRAFLPHYEVLTEDCKKNVGAKIETLKAAAERKPKSFAWKIRARVGTKNKWYRDVAEAIEV
jgi:hypothetical protein